MEIETKRASLDTMAVTIQALHVDGKQMTLAVFRQLPYILQRNELPPTYTVWGVVNYHISPSNRWVVLSSGGRLYRAMISGNLDHLPQLFIAV